VIETYNVFRSRAIGQESFVRGETNMPINHCLVVRQNVKMEDIELVLSHEQVTIHTSLFMHASFSDLISPPQALGQCKAFLKECLPKASMVPTDSTASAARALLDPPSKDVDPLKSAAICSTIVTSLFSGLEVLCAGIQDGECT